ncbi:MAG: hypothetical protein ACHQYP_10950 [Nitrospiria bacterium]
MTQILIDNSNSITETVLFYRSEDYAFYVEPVPTNAANSLSIDTLELCIDETDSRVVHVWGFCPYTAWKRASLKPPNSKRAVLRVADVQLKPGIVVKLPPDEIWPEYVDASNGWVCIGDPVAQGEAIEFAPDSVAVINRGQLLALWLHPRELPKEISS